MFPAPTNSPAYHARTLRIGRTLGDVGGSGWISGFSRVERLEFELMGLDSLDIPFAVFQELSPSLKSLSVPPTIPHPHVFNLIRSLPLLENLTLTDFDLTSRDNPQEQSSAVSPSTSPPLTGTLELRLLDGMVQTPWLFLGLPGGLRFRELKLVYYGVGGFPRAGEVMAACSETLECLEITCGVTGAFYFVPSSVQAFTLPFTHRYRYAHPDQPLRGDKTQTRQVSV